jgi:hypothetical protein
MKPMNRPTVLSSALVMAVLAGSGFGLARAGVQTAAAMRG